MPERPSLLRCRELLLEELADLRAQTVEELEKETALPGHRVDSQEVECVIATLEEKHGVEIPQVEEIAAVRVLTLDVLAEHVHGGWSAERSIES